jgi:hypothetical protein
MPSAPPPLAKEATARTAGAGFPREVIVDVPPVIGLLPGEVDLIVNMFGEALTEIFSEEDKNAAGRHGH